MVTISMAKNDLETSMILLALNLFGVLFIGISLLIEWATFHEI